MNPWPPVLFSFVNNAHKFIVNKKFCSKSNGQSMLSCRHALRMALDEELANDEKVFLLGEEVALYDGAYKISKGLHKKYGDKRIIDSPITESGFAGLVIGAAFSGLRPVCEFMSWNFSLQAIDHIINSAAKTFYMSGGQINCPVTFRGPNGAAVGVGAQHSHCFISIYATIPGLKVVAPYSAEDCKGLLKSSIRDNDPVLFLENEILYGAKFPVKDDVLFPSFTLPLGKGNIERPGTNITLVGYSISVGTCLQAAEVLSNKYQISCEVINLRSIRPLDFELISNSLKKTHNLIIVEQGFPMCGIGSEISARVNESNLFFELDSPVVRLTGVDAPMPYAISLEYASLPKPNDIVKAVKKVLGMINDKTLYDAQVFTYYKQLLLSCMLQELQNDIFT